MSTYRISKYKDVNNELAKGICPVVRGMLLCALIAVMLSGTLQTGYRCVKAAEKSEKKQTETKKFTLSAAGDCTLASDIKQPASVNFFSVYNKQKDPSYFLKKVQPVFAKDDLTLVNFEGTLSNRGKRANKKWAFRGKPKFINILKKGSVEAVSFSNNHTRDYGTISHKDTMSILRKAGISYSTETRTTIKTVNQIRVGLVSISSIETSKNPERQLRAAMKKLKKKKPEVIIVSMHSGVEYTQKIQPIQKKLSRVAIDLGADLVVGHHPHVIQGIDTYKGRYIIYSLGNFCFGGNTNPPDKDCFIFQQTFVVKKGKSVQRKNAKVIPCRVSGKDNINNYQPVISKKKRKAACISRLNKYSKGNGIAIDKKGNVSRKRRKK